MTLTEHEGKTDRGRKIVLMDNVMGVDGSGNKQTKVAKSQNIQEVVKNHDHTRLKGRCHREKEKN